LAVRPRRGADQDAVARQLTRDFAGDRDVSLGGRWVFARQATEQAAKDFRFATLIAFPLLALIALFAFRSVIAAAIPLGAGALTILTTLVILRLLDGVYRLAPAGMNMVIALGFGLSIDYSLFLLSRYREERRHGPPELAMRRTLATTGRNVAFSAVAIAAPLGALLVFPLPLLQSLGIEGMLVPVVAAAVALVIVPAVLVALGDRVHSTQSTPSDSERRWQRIARAVTARPGSAAAIALVIVALAATPALGVHFVSSDAGSLSPAQSARVVSDTVSRQDASPVEVVISAAPNAHDAVRRFAATLANVPSTRLVSPPRYVGAGVWVIQAAVRGNATSPETQHAIAALRAAPAPFQVLVGGDAAAYADQLAAIRHSLRLAGVMLAVTSWLVLWLMTGSAVLPIKGLVMSAVTVASALGTLVLIFGDIDAAVFITVAAIGFGLSTDYSVFLLGRIAEARQRCSDERSAIAAGLSATGGLLTAAALMLAVTLGALVTSKLRLVQQFGVGTALAVLVDAFVIRAVLVPSLMAFLGRWNWWTPAWLARVHRSAMPHEQPAP
jgi:uncharacterized membrane protein YdfJ with MMPL/SSD domain